MKSDLYIWKVKTFSQLTTSELYHILEARIAVFVVEQNCPYEETDGADEYALHLWAEQDGKIVAYCRIFPPHIKYNFPSIGRVLTHKNYRRKNLGKLLLNFAVQVVESRYKTAEIMISAQDYLLDFYQNFGFRSTGKKYLEDDIPHTEMKRTEA